MITKEELLKQKTHYEEVKEIIDNMIDGELKRIYPDTLKDHKIEITLKIPFCGLKDTYMHKILSEYVTKGGYTGYDFKFDFRRKSPDSNESIKHFYITIFYD